MAPVGVVGGADVLHRQRDVVIGGDGEREGAVGGRDDHTVTIGLLDKEMCIRDSLYPKRLQRAYSGDG